MIASLVLAPSFPVCVQYGPFNLHARRNPALIVDERADRTRKVLEFAHHLRTCLGL